MKNTYNCVEHTLDLKVKVKEDGVLKTVPLHFKNDRGVLKGTLIGVPVNIPLPKDRYEDVKDFEAPEFLTKKSKEDVLELIEKFLDAVYA